MCSGLPATFVIGGITPSAKAEKFVHVRVIDEFCGIIAREATAALRGLGNRNGEVSCVIARISECGSKMHWVREYVCHSNRAP